MTNADATQVNANVTAILSFVNTEVVQRDASIAFTVTPLGPNADPTLDNQFARKKYVDQIMPAGSVVPFAGAVAPTGWLLCNGATYDGTNPLYARLYATIGLTYGGSGSNFVVPNTGGKTIFGKDGSTEFAALNTQGGAKTTSQVPNHVHDFTHGHSAGSGLASSDHTHGYSGSTTTDGLHSHTTVASQSFVVSGAAASFIGSGGFGVGFDGNTANAGSHSHTFSGSTGGFSSNHTHGITVDAFGGNTPNNIGGVGSISLLNPYLTLNHIIKL